MLTDERKRPTLDERYEAACNASDLSVQEVRRTAADVLIAAGWSPVRLGGALLRLHSEYDSSERLRRRESVTQTDVALLVGRLKHLGPVTEQVELLATHWNMEGARHKARAVVLWWLDRTCGSCFGRRYQVAPGTPMLTNRVCPKCRGLGEQPLPHGQDGRRLANFIDSCISDARGAIASNLSARRTSPNKVVAKPNGYAIIARRDCTRR